LEEIQKFILNSGSTNFEAIADFLK